MTQQELADLAGCTRQTIGPLEQGGYAPSPALAFRISWALGVGIEEVVEFVPCCHRIGLLTGQLEPTWKAASLG